MGSTTSAVAEAVVEDSVTRYFCQHCTVDIAQVLPEFRCPNCNMRLVEELERNEPEEEDNNSDIDSEDILDPPSFERRRRPRITMPSEENRFENFIVDLFQNLNTGGLRTQGAAGRGANPFLLEGILGDNAFNREELDMVVTYLLNQMDGNGPPPLTKGKIKEIPVVNIMRDQIENNLECSVCCEEFHLGEPVRKLGCEHVYHENCIIPWLELHGTCPICRKTLSDDSGEMQQDEDGQMEDATSLSEGLALLISRLQGTQRASHNPNHSRTTTLSDTENSSNSSLPASSSGSSGSNL